MGDICVAYTVSTSLLLIRCVCSAVSYSEAPGTVAHQASLSMGFSRQEYRSGLPSPPPGDLPNPGMETASLISSALADRFFTTSATWEAHVYISYWSVSLTDTRRCTHTQGITRQCPMHYDWGSIIHGT